LAIFTFILLLGRIFKLSELVINKGVSLFDVMKLLIYILPNLLGYTIPMAFLIGVLIGFGRLSSDHELTAMKASGISLFQLVKPVLVVALVCYFLAAFILIFGLPWGSHGFRKTLYEIARTKAHLELKPGVFNDTFNGLVFFVNTVSSDGSQMEGVLIQDERDPEKTQTILAKTVHIASNPESREVILMLQNGSVHIKDQKHKTYRKIDFDHYFLKLDIDKSLGRGKRIRIMDHEKPVGELKREIQKKAAQGEDNRQGRWVLNRKFSIPFASIVFGLLGIPLGISPPRSGRSYGLVIGLVIIIGYYLFMKALESLTTAGILSPLVATWIPNFVFLFLGIYLLIIRGLERQSIVMEWGGRIFDKLSTQFRASR